MPSPYKLRQVRLSPSQSEYLGPRNIGEKVRIMLNAFIAAHPGGTLPTGVRPAAPGLYTTMRSVRLSDEQTAWAKRHSLEVSALVRAAVDHERFKDDAEYAQYLKLQQKFGG